MRTRVAINGFGRIGRNTLRGILSRGSELEVVAINDLTDPAALAQLFEYDSILGRFPERASAEGESLVVGEHRIRALAERDPAALPWAELGVDVVLESTGRFTSREAASAHLDAGARVVIVTAPAAGADLTVVVGVNDGLLDLSRQRVLSNASCTTNCLATVLRVFQDAFGIEQGIMTTTHAYTGDQNLHDGPHKDPRRARAAALNIVPTSTGAATAIGLVMPELEGRLSGRALRVPVPTGSYLEVALQSSTPGLTAERVNAAFRAAAAGPAAKYLEYSEAPLVSSDVIGTEYSAVFDSGLTAVFGNTVQISAWYDNEWGYTTRLIDLTERVGQALPARS